MSRKITTPLHIEWTPAWVRAVNTATGKTAEGIDVTELGPILDGHRHAVVGMGRSSVFLRTPRLPKASPEDLRRILSVQVGQLFPLPADQLSFDFVQTTDTAAEGVLTVVAAIRADDLRQMRRELSRVDIEPLRVLPVALAAPAVARSAAMRDALVMEETPHGLSLDVVQNGALLFSRFVAATDDPLREAERTLAAAKTDALPYVVTGSARLPNAVVATKDALALLDEAPSFNFELTDDVILRAKQRVTARTRLGVLLLVSAILLIALVWADRSDEAAKVVRGQGAWARQLTKLRSIRDAETVKSSTAVAVQDVVSRAFTTAQPIGDIAAVVGDSLPPDAWLTGLNLERGKSLEIRGTAKTSDDVRKFVNALGANARFRDVKLVFANSATVGKTPVVQFNVNAVAVGNLPMPVPIKIRGTATRRAATPTGTGGSS